MNNTIKINNYIITKKVKQTQNYTFYIVKNNGNEYILKYCFNNDVYGIASLKNEVKALLKLEKCKFVPKLIEYNFNENNYIIMEKVEGNSLNVYKGKSINYIIDIMIKVVEAVSFIHENGIIHCDLKPSNIFVDVNNEIKILDFGISICDGYDNFSEYGSLQYSSPEKILRQKIDYRHDIFSLGVIFYELIEGKLPFSEIKDIKEKANNQANFCIPLIVHNNPRIDYLINSFLKKATNKDRNLRYMSLGGMMESLINIKNTLYIEDLNKTEDITIEKF